MTLDYGTMKKFFTLCFAVTLANVFIENTVVAKSLLITLKDGTQVYYLLGGERNPVMQFPNEKTVSINDDRYTITEVSRFEISKTDDPTGIEKHSLYVEGDRQIEIYTLDGKKVYSKTSSADGFSVLSTANLPTGTYVVKIGNQTLKISKK